MIAAPTQIRHVRARAFPSARPVTRRGRGASGDLRVAVSSSIRQVGPLIAAPAPLAALLRLPGPRAFAPDGR